MSSLSTGEGVATECVDQCRKLANWLAAGRITFEEYASNVTDTAVYSPIDGIPSCVDTLPLPLVSAYMDYLRAALESVDFMPCPRPFLAGDVSEQVFNRRKQELRPKYLRLYQLMKEKERELGVREETGNGHGGDPSLSKQPSRP